MSTYRKPTKQQVHDYLVKRSHSREPVPSIEEIRRQLGWKLIQKR